jgi:hypothetical protein
VTFAGPAEARYEADLNRITRDQEHDGSGGRGRLRRERRSGGGRQYQRYLPADQIGGHRRQSLVAVFRPAVLDADVLMLEEAAVAETLPEGIQRLGTVCRRETAKRTDHRHRRLLRARRKRPCRRAAKQGNQVASFQLIELHLVIRSQSRIGRISN